MGRSIKKQQIIRIDRLQEVCSDVDNAKSGYGYSAFRAKTKISNSSFYRVMYDGKDFGVDVLYKISMETGVSIDWLLGLSDVKYLKKGVSPINETSKPA